MDRFEDYEEPPEVQDDPGDKEEPSAIETRLMNKNASGKTQLSRNVNSSKNPSTPQNAQYVLTLNIPDKLTTRFRPNDSGGNEKQASEQKNTVPKPPQADINPGSKDSIDDIKEFISATGERFYL